MRVQAGFAVHIAALTAIGLSMLLVSGTIARADFIQAFSGSSGTLAASVEFRLAGSTLEVVLANTSAADVRAPRDVLTAVFFNVAGNPTWTPLSALLADGSQVYYDLDGQPTEGNVGGEWAYRSSIARPALAGVNQGIGSVGFGLFGGANFGGSNLAGPSALGGIQYGILSAGDDPLTGNGAVRNSGGLVQNSIVFSFLADPSLAAGDISNVLFQYGGGLGQPRFAGEPSNPSAHHPDPGTVAHQPEPATLAALLGMTLTGVGIRAVSRRRRGQA